MATRKQPNTPPAKPGAPLHVGKPCKACGSRGYVHYRDHEHRRQELGLKEGE